MQGATFDVGALRAVDAQGDGFAVVVGVHVHADDVVEIGVDVQRGVGGEGAVGGRDGLDTVQGVDGEDGIVAISGKEVPAAVGLLESVGLHSAFGGLVGAEASVADAECAAGGDGLDYGGHVLAAAGAFLKYYARSR